MSWLKENILEHLFAESAQKKIASMILLSQYISSNKQKGNEDENENENHTRRL